MENIEEKMDWKLKIMLKRAYKLYLKLNFKKYGRKQANAYEWYEKGKSDHIKRVGMKCIS